MTSQFILRTLFLLIAVVASVLAWVVSLCTPLAGWMIIPLALGVAVFVGRRLRGRITYRAACGVLCFFGACFVGWYATVWAHYGLGVYEHLDALHEVSFFLFAMAVLSPAVLIIVFLLVRAIIVAWNST